MTKEWTWQAERAALVKRVKELEGALREIADYERYDRNNGLLVLTDQAVIARAALEGEKT